MKKSLSVLLAALLAIFMVPGGLIFAGEKEEPQPEVLRWVLQKPQKEQELPENWYELIEKTAANVERLAGMMRPTLEDARGFSPLSLYMALMAVRPGLSEDARERLDEKLNTADMSEDELAEGLLVLHSLGRGYNPQEESFKIWESHTFALADSSLEFHPDYLKELEKSGMAALQGNLSDEQSFRDLNALINHYTHGLIDPVYSDEEIREKTRDALLNILVNTLYFRDSWAQKFDPKMTRDKTFHGSKAESEVSMMSQQSMEMPYLETEDYTAVRKAYSGGAGMMILMPKSKVSEEEYWDFLKEAKESEDWITADVSLTLPKWQLSSRFSLDQAVEALGLSAILKNDEGQRFFTEKIAMEMGSAIQQVELRVNEEGTEAAVVTILETKAMTMPAPNPQKTLVVDHPFVYSIDEQGLSLIQGIVGDLP